MRFSILFFSVFFLGRRRRCRRRRNFFLPHHFRMALACLVSTVTMTVHSTFEEAMSEYRNGAKQNIHSGIVYVRHLSTYMQWSYCASYAKLVYLHSRFSHPYTFYFKTGSSKMFFSHKQSNLLPHTEFTYYVRSSICFRRVRNRNDIFFFFFSTRSAKNW